MQHLLDAVVGGGHRRGRRRGRRRPRTRPSANTVTPAAASTSSSSGNCCEQLGVDARAVLVPRPQVVAERLDDVVGGHADVGGALLQHLQHGARPRPGWRATSSPVVGHVRRQREVVAEQLVGPVDQVDLEAHGSILAGRASCARTDAIGRRAMLLDGVNHVAVLTGDSDRLHAFSTERCSTRPSRTTRWWPRHAPVDHRHRPALRVQRVRDRRQRRGAAPDADVRPRPHRPHGPARGVAGGVRRHPATG